MKTGFSENELVEIYLDEMMPLIMQWGIPVRLELYYQRLLRLYGIGNDIFGNPISQNEGQAAEAKKLFGHRIIHAAPQSWLTMEVILSSEKMPHEYYDAPIESRARWRAGQIIQGMIRVVERHKDEQARKKPKT